MKNLLKNNDGVAIIMVLTAITLLTALLTDFTFESKLNKLKTYNNQDKSQAKLNAESGLKFALARLKNYQEAFNAIQKNESLKKQIKQEDLNLIWSIPFIYPIPSNDKMSIIQRTAIADFEKNSMIQGDLKVEISSVSHLLNLNLLRISALIYKKPAKTEDSQSEKEKDEEKDTDFNLDNQLVSILKNALEKKRETDEEFNNKYADRDPLELVSALKHFISDQDSYEDQFSQSLTADYSTLDFTVKYAPYSSLSEIYFVKGFDDQIADLITSELTVHGSIIIDLNKLTNKTLKILLPDLDEEQIKDFFKYRDDPSNPKYFNSIDDFKNYIVNIAKFTTEKTFNERIKKFEANGIKFGVGGSLFKVIASGTYGRSTYTITCFVSLPAKPVPPPAPKAKTNQTKDEDADGIVDEDQSTTPKDQSNQPEKKQPIELLAPRVVEIIAG